ncbi:MAG: prepilin-type N-terminal cleavage/methylation domain-containing protein [Candidatus Omnitrophota bacterium]
MKRGYTVIELILVIVIIGIIFAITVPNLTRGKIVANESAAQANLRIISMALENYATANNGIYPTSEASLTGANPPYLSRSFCGSTVSGFTYSCTLQSTTYTVSATPANCGNTGSHNYNITLGGGLGTSNCP